VIIFKNPWLLLLLAPLALLAALAWLQADRRADAAGVPSGMPPSRSLRALAWRWLPAWTRVLAAFLLIFALARPQRVSRGEVPPTEGIDIMLVLDTSLSMAAMDFTPDNRMQAAKGAAADFVKKRRNDRIGLTIFGGNALLTCPLTLDYQSVQETIESAELGMSGADGTAIGDAIVTAVNHLKNSKAKSKVMILLTDGRSNTGLITDLPLAARTAAAHDIKVYTIGTAGKGPAQVPTGNPLQPVMYLDEDLDEPTLREIAGLTGGEFYRAKNSAELQRIYGTIDSLERTTFEVKVYTSYRDLYPYLLLPGLLLLAAALALDRTWLRTVP
jgi:Ca-activated chloride channel homolog